jgi:hypothetical protein
MLKFLLIVGIAGSLWYFWARDIALKLPSSWCEIAVSCNEASIMGCEGKSFSGRLRASSVCFSGGVLLAVQPDHARMPVRRFLFRDAMHPGDFRRLRVGVRKLG